MSDQVENPGQVMAQQDPPSQVSEGGGKETPPANGTPAVEEQVLELDLSIITQTNDGKFELKDPDNPEGTIYRGDTVDDLLKNIVKGNRDKDRFISEMKAKGISAGHLKDERTPKGSEDDDNLAFPDPQDVLANVVKEMKLDSQMMSWGKEEWKAHEAENGAVETLELKSQVRRAQDIAQGRVAEENVRILNNVNLEEETQTIREMMADSGLDVDAIDWDKVFKEAITDSNNYKKSGIRRSGRVVARAEKAIRSVLREKIHKDVTKSVEEDILSGRRKAREIESPGSTAGAARTPKQAPAKTLDEAYDRAMKAFK